MIINNIECERTEPIAPEAYRCRWQDRNTLVLGLLSMGKGSRITEHAGIEGAKGIVGRRYAVVTVESYS